MGINTNSENTNSLDFKEMHMQILPCCSGFSVFVLFEILAVEGRSVFSI